MELATGNYIDTEVTNYFAPSKKVYIKIIIALIVFLAYILIMNFIIKMLYEQDQKRLKSKAETDLLTGVLNKISTEQTIQDISQLEKQIQARCKPILFCLIKTRNNIFTVIPKSSYYIVILQ